MAVSASAATETYTQRYVSTTVEVQSATTRLARVQCGAGEINTGGGFFVDGTTDPSAYTVIADRPDGANGWTAGIFLSNGYGPVDLTVHAVCVKRVSGAALTRTVVTAAGQATSGDVANVVATCPSGYVRTGGGYYLSSLSTTRNTVLLNAPYVDNGWIVSYYGESGDEFWGQVVCVKVPADAALTVRAVTTSFAVPGQSTATGTAACAKSEATTGGGWSVSDIDPTRYVVRGSEPQFRRVGGHSWRLSVFSDFDNESAQLDARVVALCVKTAY